MFNFVFDDITEVNLIGVLNGEFNSDEVMACAITQMLYPQARIIRTRNPKILKKCDILFNVGDPDQNKYCFNAHKKAFQLENEDFISATGCAWELFGRKILSQMKIEDKIAQMTIDAIWPIMKLDNENISQEDKALKCGLTQIISTFLPNSEKSEGYDISFQEALLFCKEFLVRIIVRGISQANQTFIAYEKLSKNTDIVVFDNINEVWKKVLISNWDKTLNVKIVIQPNGSGLWKIECVQKDKVPNHKITELRCEMIYDKDHAPEKELEFTDDANCKVHINDSQSIPMKFNLKCGYLVESKEDAIKIAQFWLNF